MAGDGDAGSFDFREIRFVLEELAVPGQMQKVRDDQGENLTLSFKALLKYFPSLESVIIPSSNISETWMIDVLLYGCQLTCCCLRMSVKQFVLTKSDDLVAFLKVNRLTVPLAHHVDPHYTVCSVVCVWAVSKQQAGGWLGVARKHCRRQAKRATTELTFRARVLLAASRSDDVGVFQFFFYAPPGQPPSHKQASNPQSGDGPRPSPPGNQINCHHRRLRLIWDLFYA
uniref:DHHA2 domain-containing protein n=1 Tax=Panagrellus redivivus TaxID=6233 RepID=A0A7E4USW7_PANRE